MRTVSWVWPCDAMPPKQYKGFMTGQKRIHKDAVVVVPSF